ncbi:hypothetical protein RHS04_01428 [Rhizoctonia solani]|uniref:Uncharacterized protein n=1 Tax=Rhizoctonia solani TaxID=456999 RepID=A0A8H7HFZ4_9AGAM|nr:hypothetical protein RHS04_01428 [Rhizoctonia solani]
MLLADQSISATAPSTQHSTISAASTCMDLSRHPSPTYPLRSITPTVTQLLGASSNTARPFQPPLSFQPRLPAALLHLSASSRVIAPLPVQPNKKTSQRNRTRKRQRLQESSSEGSGEDSTSHVQKGRTRPSMLLSASHTAPTNIQVATQSLALVRPVQTNNPALVPPVFSKNLASIPPFGSNSGSAAGDDGDDNDDDDDGDSLSNRSLLVSTGDDKVLESLYEEPRQGDVADLRELCVLVNKLLENQTKLSHNIKQIDTRTRQMNTYLPNEPIQANKGAHVSPPEPTLPINWDQTIQYNAPAGRRRRAKRHVLLMALIRETIFRLLARHSVHDPLPPPPPPSLRAPTITNFAVRWDESRKSIFNQLAAQIVAEKIVCDQPGMLTADEVESLPVLVSKHIKYLCRCYKDQNREDAEEFNARRLNRCGMGTRKRQLFATRLQVVDMFPEHLGKHRHLIAHLGIDGTSSDEEDPKNSGTYKIKNKPQLSNKVTLLKRFVFIQLTFGPDPKVAKSIGASLPTLIQLDLF